MAWMQGADGAPAHGCSSVHQVHLTMPYPSFHRLVELFSSAPIGSHWGVLSKCLTYSKAASDPFVYSLLRHQYRKSCKDILNRIFNRRTIRSAGLAGDSHSQNILPVSE
jgi:G protein-coupled receptor 26